MRKRALGKGLEALIPDRGKETLSEGYRVVQTSEIRPNPYQPRADFNEGELKDLIASIKEKGIIEPLIVKRSGEKFILAAGERRLRAAQVAGLTEVPVIIKELTDQELLEIGLIENLHRRDLNPVEEAFAYDELNRKFGLTHERIAQLVGKDRSSITNTMRLLTLPEKIKNYLRQRLLNEGHARIILSLSDDTLRQEVADRIVRENLSVRAAEILVKKLMHKPKIVPGKDKGANLLMLEDEIARLLQTKVSIEWKKNKGTISIHCFSLDDFDRIYNLLKKLKK